MKLSSLSLGLTLAVAAVAGGGTAFAQSVSSTFQNVCTNIRYGVDSVNTPVIAASCLRNDMKTRVDSFVVLGGFRNNEGQLNAGPGPSTFHQSCRNARIEVVGSKVMLSANCPKTGNTQYADSSREIMDIMVVDGQLRHRFAGGGKVVPPVR